MNNGKYVFSQFVEYLPQRIFYEISQSYEGDKYSKYFTTWNQLLCMIFGQLCNRNSLRDLVSFINAHSNKAYHLGLGKSVQLSNFAYANENRNCKIFEDFMNRIIAIAKEKVVAKDFEIEGKIYAFDSSTIDLCLSFYWAKFRTTKNGIKLHALYDTQASIPVLVNITEAKLNDVNGLDFIDYEAGSYYIMDKGYVDYGRLFRIENHEAYFVTRIKKGTKYKNIKKLKYKKSTGVFGDKIIKLTGLRTQKKYPKNLRLVFFYDEESKRKYEFVSNNFLLKSEEIALLYKQRWAVELFFKWIKQHLKIKKYWGQNENAVRIQIYTAITTYCLVSVIKNELKIEKSTYEILRILSGSLLDKTPIYQLLTENGKASDDINAPEQLILLGF